MFISNLLTRYIMLPLYYRLCIFFLFYLIIIKVFDYDFKIEIAECGPKRQYPRDYLAELKHVYATPQDWHLSRTGTCNALSNLNERLFIVEDKIETLAQIPAETKPIHEHLNVAQNQVSDCEAQILNSSIEETKSKTLTLESHQQEFRHILAQQVAESKNQQEVIENLRNSFERKLQAKDLLLQNLQQKNIELSAHVARLETDMREIRTALMTGRGFVEPAASKQEFVMTQLASTTQTHLSSQIKQSQLIHSAEIKQIAEVQQQAKTQLNVIQTLSTVAASKP